MDPEQWERAYLAEQRRLAKIDAIHKWRHYVIAYRQRRSTFWMTGYFVIIFAGMAMMNKIVMAFSLPCGLLCTWHMAVMNYQLYIAKYPGEES